MKTKTFTTKNVLTIVALGIFQISFAQNAPENLASLEGYEQTIYYSPDSRERATEIAVFMDNAGIYLQKELNFTPKVKMYILEPQHWEQYAKIPIYGFPHNIDPVNLVIAAQDNPFWQSFLPPLDQLPPPVVERINRAYQKADGSYSMQAFFDLLALHEMGHSYHDQAGLKMQRHWMKELFVNIMLHTYVAEKQPELLPGLETLPDLAVNAPKKPEFTTLADFEAKYGKLHLGSMTGENYGWYQFKFNVAAKNLYDEGGKMVLIKLWNALKNHQEDMTDEEFISMLKNEVHPALSDFYLNWDKNI